MRSTFRHAVVVALSATFCALASAQSGWTLVWQDEFDGSAIDPDHWEFMIGDGTAYGLPSGWGNNELQYYTNRPENARVQNGKLTITAREENYAGKRYTSARLRSRGLADFRYGRFEARIRVPRGQGMWPAFWMLPTDSPYGGWAAGGEIDIMETVNVPLRSHGTIHHGGQWPNNQSNGGSFTDGTDLSALYHTYAMEWEPDQIRWYVDGEQFHAVSSAAWFSENAPDNDRAPFDVFFHMLLNVAVGGNWPGPPDDTTQFPQTMDIDWVRVSTRDQSPFGGEPHAVPGLVQAEDFDEGGAGQAYADSDAGNNGGAYRNDTDVDIEACSEGGFNIGWIREGEWTEYTVEAAQSTSVRVLARVSSPTGGRFRIEIDGVDRTGELTVPDTNGWQTWQTIQSEPFPVFKGEHVVRFVNTGTANEQFNLNWLEFAPAKPSIRPGLPRP